MQNIKKILVIGQSGPITSSIINKEVARVTHQNLKSKLFKKKNLIFINKICTYNFIKKININKNLSKIYFINENSEPIGKKKNYLHKKIIDRIAPVYDILEKLRSKYKNIKFSYIFLDNQKKIKENKLNNIQNVNEVSENFILKLIEFYKSKFNVKCNYIIVSHSKHTKLN